MRKERFGQQWIELIVNTMTYLFLKRKLPIASKGWFPYNRYDRYDRCDHWKKKASAIVAITRGNHLVPIVAKRKPA